MTERCSSLARSEGSRPKEGSPWDKGERLAQLVRKQPTLLILDGVEPLQSPEATDDAGQIRDPGLQALIRELASRNTGLLVISTRARIRDIVGRENSSVVSHSLDYLSIAAGTELLKVIGVQGTDEELGVAVEEVGGHALSVTLVGKYVTRAANGHIEDRYEIGIPRVDFVARSPDENTEDATDSLHTAVTPDVVEIGKTLVPGAGERRNKDHVAKTFSRIMKRYEVWLSGLQDREGDFEVRGRLALEIVRLTGLFDRPITAGEFVALIKGVTIKPPREKTMFEKAWDAQNMELVQMALQLMQMQATDAEKARINEAIEANDVDTVKVISQEIAKREESSSEETEQAVTIEGPIEGLTDLASAATEDEVNLAVDRLVEYGLITNVGNSRIHLDVPAWPDPAASAVVLDAHPLVREHFAEQLKQEHKSSSVEAHRRLYEHLKQSAPELPDNLNDMMPLYHAVAHGCKAGLWQEARTVLFRDRILRSSEFYAWRKLGAFGASLSALAHFFSRPWSELESALPEAQQTFVLNWTSSSLRALGRLAQTREPMAIGLRVEIDAKHDWKNAAVTASNLSELSLTLGDVSSAVRQGEQSVELADRSGDAFRRMSLRTTLADALRCASGTRSVSGKALAAGDAGSDSKEPAAGALRLTALAAFRETEAMQKEMQPQYPQLYSQRGYKYCELLLEQCRASRGWHARSEKRSGERQGPARDNRRSEHDSPGNEPAASALPLTGEDDDVGTSLRSVRPTDGSEHPQREQTLAQLREVRTRADTALEIVVAGSKNLLDRGLNHLTLGRTWLLEAEFVLGWPRLLATGVAERREVSEPDSETSCGSATQVDEQPVPPVEAGSTEKDSQPASVSNLFTHATTHLNESVDLLRQAGQQDNLPRGLLHRAALWRVLLEAGATAGSSSSAQEARLGKSTVALSPEELFDKANKDLTEVETIAERGSMLIWQIEAALERSRLYFMLHQMGWEVEVDESNADASNDNNEVDPGSQGWLAMAREKLDETKKLIIQTEKPYEPYEPMDEIWKDHPEGKTWEPPSYVGVFKKGQIVGYHCRNEEIEWLEQQIFDLEQNEEG